MVERPEDHLDLFIQSGADMISIHAEATAHLQRSLQKLKNDGIKAGVALNPSTPITELEHVLDVVDYVTVMTVNPGFAGQSFVPLMYKKIKKIKELIQSEGYQIDIQVDGNIGFETIPGVLKNGADMLVCGTSCLFKNDVLLEDAVVFTDLVKPILQTKCMSCHNNKKAKGDLKKETEKQLSYALLP